MSKKDVLKTIELTEEDANRFYLVMCDELIDQMETDLNIITDKVIKTYPKKECSAKSIINRQRMEEHAELIYRQYLELYKIISKTKEEVLKLIVVL